MKAFRYVARIGPGEQTEGVMGGESPAGVSRALIARGLFPITVAEVAADGALAGRLAPLQRWSRAVTRRRSSSQGLALFTRRLGDLLDAGVPMQRAMAQLHLQAGERSLKHVLGRVADRVGGGESLSQALASQDPWFPSSLIGAIEAGETGGGLVPILRGLAELYEKDDDLQRTVRGALVYPVLVVLVSLATLLVMFMYLLPRLSLLYEDIGQRLPGPTRFLIGVSAFGEAHGAAVGAILVGVLVVALVLRARSRRFRRMLALARLHTPFLGRIVRCREIVRFAHTLASLVGGGVPLVRSLWFASRSSANEVVGEELRTFGQRVGEGASLSAAVGESRLGDDVLVMMIQIGEEMGQLPGSLEKACRIYERELRDKMKVITTVLEPLLIVAIGLIVGFIVFSMMLPIMELDLV